MGRSLDAKSIKSAQRVFEVLEYFDAEHQEASLTDIAQRYGYPQSSASELLSYMVALGYLRRTSRSRYFCLSMRVAMLGAWVQPELIRSGRLLKLIDELAEKTDGTVVLATNTSVRVQVLQVVRRSDEAPAQCDLLPLLHSAEGRALLLTSSRELVRKYVHRLNSEATDDAERLKFEDLAADLDESSVRGYVRRVEGNIASFAILLPNSDRSEPLALGVRVPVEIREEAVVREMRSVVSRNLGLVSIPSALPPHAINTRFLAQSMRYASS